MKTYADTAPVPWANGAGSTVQLVGLEESPALTPGLPRWRLSVATLERPAEFSPLPGLHRTFMPVGAEVVLRIDGERRGIADGTTCEFDGGAATELVELPARCNAVNLMTEGADGIRMRPRPAAGNGRETGPGAALCLTLDDSGGFARFTLLRPARGRAPAPLQNAAALLHLPA